MFMQEYEDLEHMAEVNESTGLRYFIPHQSVIREESEE